VVRIQLGNRTAPFLSFPWDLDESTISGKNIRRDWQQSVLMVLAQFSLQRLTNDAQRPRAKLPCGLRSVTTLNLEHYKGANSLKTRLDSKVGFSDGLRGDLAFVIAPWRIG